MNSKINDLTNEISETKEDLQDLSEQMQDHLRTTTTTTTTTTVDPRLHFEKIGPFRPSANNKIGEITKYYHNYEFSMELKFGSLQGPTQLIQGVVEETNPSLN